MTATRNSLKRLIFHLMRYDDNLIKIYFSAGWLVRADLQNRDTRHVPTEVKSGSGILK